METRIETNKYVHGISMCHIAFRGKDTPEGLPTWDTPIALPGAVKLEDSHKGEEQIKYADNGAYVVISNSIGSEVKLTVVRLPLDLRAKMFNDRVDANGGVVKGQSTTATEFALLYQYEGDKEPIRGVYYSCTATRPGTSHETDEETIKLVDEEITMTAKNVKVSATEVASNYELPRTAKSQTAYDNFFKQVTPPAPMV